jgi:hypothetical protein
VRKVLYLVRRSSLDDTAVSLLCPDSEADDMEVTVVLLEGAEVSPVRVRRTLKLVVDGKNTGDPSRGVPTISYADLIGRVFDSDTVVVL